MEKTPIHILVAEADKIATTIETKISVTREELRSIILIILTLSLPPPIAIKVFTVLTSIELIIPVSIGDMLIRTEEIVQQLLYNDPNTITTIQSYYFRIFNIILPSILIWVIGSKSMQAVDLLLNISPQDIQGITLHIKKAITATALSAYIYTPKKKDPDMHT